MNQKIEHCIATLQQGRDEAWSLLVDKQAARGLPRAEVLELLGELSETSSQLSYALKEIIAMLAEGRPGIRDEPIESATVVQFPAR